MIDSVIYFDGQHLMADTLDELHAEAKRIGLKPEWFQGHPRHPHYDAWGAPRRKLSVNCTSRQMLRLRRGKQIKPAKTCYLAGEVRPVADIEMPRAALQREEKVFCANTRKNRSRGG